MSVTVSEKRGPRVPEPVEGTPESIRGHSRGTPRALGASGLAVPGAPRASPLRRTNFGIVWLLCRLIGRKPSRRNAATRAQSPGASNPLAPWSRSFFAQWAILLFLRAGSHVVLSGCNLLVQEPPCERTCAPGIPSILARSSSRSFLSLRTGHSVRSRATCLLLPLGFTRLSEDGADPVGEAGMPILRDFGPESPRSVRGVRAQ